MTVTELLDTGRKKLEEAGKISKGSSIMIIPCGNPYSVNIKKRFWSIDNTDINRMFPGYGLGETVDAGKSVYRVAVMGGAGADSIDRAKALGCDTYVTADIKYHQFQRALDLGLNLIDADHFSTENPVIPALFDMLRTRHADVRFLVSELHHPIIRFA